MAAHLPTPDWLVERLACGELPRGAAGEVRSRLAAEGGLGRVEALARSDRELLGRYPPGPAVGAIRRRLFAATVRPVLRAGWLVPAAAGLALFLAPPPPAHDPAAGGPGEVTRVKGSSPALAVHRRVGAAAETLAPGAAVAPGDLLQLAYRAAGHGYGAVLSVDGRGAVALHAPSGEDVAPRLAADVAVLPFAYELDDAPSFERFVLVTADAPFDVSAVLAAARDLAARDDAASAPLALPPTLSQTSFLLVKVPAP